MISPLVFTIRERCRVCYTCVRECPAKAIRIIGGQAEVISERCIGCGNCVQVCSQKAKQVVDNTDEVKELLKVGKKSLPSWHLPFQPSFLELHTGACLECWTNWAFQR